MSKSVAESLFLKIIEEKYNMMLKKQVENPNLVLPKHFDKFIKNSLFIRFLLAIYDYCLELQKLENKHQLLELHAKERFNAHPKLLTSEMCKISDKLKDVSDIYCMIVLQKCSYNYMYRDQNFFETLIYFISQVLKYIIEILREMFERKDFKFIEEEINRIFRTNTFNIIKRRHIEDDFEGRAPPVKDTVEHLIEKLQRMSCIPRRKVKYQMQLEKSEIKPYFIKQTPCASIHSRSPLIAMILPSAKERLFQQEQERKQRHRVKSLWLENVGRSRSLNGSEVKNKQKQSQSFY